MNIESERERLSQEKKLEYLRRELKPIDMVTVYQSKDGEDSRKYIFCALIPFDQIEWARSKRTWYPQPGREVPEISENCINGKREVKYLRYANDRGIEPLVIFREFYGHKGTDKEISEEFRLFHNLYHNRKTDEYIKIDDEGKETKVVVIKPDCIQIRLKEISQFLAVKEMHLLIRFSYTERSAYPLEKLGREEDLIEQQDRQQEDRIFWWLYYGDHGDNSFSELHGNRFIEPLPKSEIHLSYDPYFKGFDKQREKKYLEFIIAIDENGEEIVYTCNPDALANYFGANPNAPADLTPVHFRKEVLNKYYQQPGKFTVGEETVSHDGLWHLNIDNHHDDKVCAWLGDLGRGLPYNEQFHWREYNIPPEGNMSDVYRRRQLLGDWDVETDQPDILFKKQYDEFQKLCREHLGWHLLLPLDLEDQHHLQSLRIPASDEQRDFDELVLTLTKILIDSLHVKRLNSLLSDEQKEGLGQGGIARFEAVLASRNVEGAAGHIAFLRKLQGLRSSSSAHRKGSKYQKIAKQFDLESQNLQDVFSRILWQALDFLNFLVSLVRSGSVDNVEENKIEEGYAILRGIVGFVDSGATDGSVNHDDLIYELRSKP